LESKHFESAGGGKALMTRLLIRARIYPCLRNRPAQVNSPSLPRLDNQFDCLGADAFQAGERIKIVPSLTSKVAPSD